MDPRLERIHAFSRGILERSSTLELEHSFGTAYFNEHFPQIWDMNYLLVDGTPEIDERKLIEEAEELHSRLGHSHRQICFEHLEAAPRGGWMERAGYTRERILWMVHENDTARLENARPAVELEPHESRVARASYWKSTPSAPATQQLVDKIEVTAKATDLLIFGSMDDGQVVSVCDLYSDGRTAQVEDVITLEDYRGRGHATSTVASAVRHAKETGHELVFLIADSEDWPRHLYAALGFEGIGEGCDFLKTPSTTRKGPA